MSKKYYLVSKGRIIMHGTEKQCVRRLHEIESDFPYMELEIYPEEALVRRV